MKVNLLIYSLFFIGFSCEVSKDSKAKEEQIVNEEHVVSQILKDVEVEEFSRLIKKEGQILDVRTANEYSNGHIASSTNYDIYDNNFENQVKKMSKDKPVYVYCAKGGRSAKAMKILGEQGFNKVYNLVGGYLAWTSKGMPVEK